MDLANVLLGVVGGSLLIMCVGYEIKWYIEYRAFRRDFPRSSITYRYFRAA